MLFHRILDLKNTGSSAFVFGPRLTGKTTLLRGLNAGRYFDLLDPELELQYSRRPALFGEQIAALPDRSLIVVDEIQKVPELLNYVQMGIDRQKHVFLLSGSSARKLKRAKANLLGGRALDLRLHPLTHVELGKSFSLDRALQYGTIPKISSLLLETGPQLAAAHLKSYVTFYIKEEIQAEAITRNVGAFQRFLAVAAQNNAREVAFSNIARDCAVPASTVKEYFQILDDTLIAYLLPGYHKKERLKTHSKCFFFDCGVVNAICNRLQDPPTPAERGFLFETWFVNEVRRLRDYGQKAHELVFWRERGHEVDLVVMGGRGPIMAFECKSGEPARPPLSVSAFRQKFPAVPVCVVSAGAKAPRIAEGVEILPWKDALERYSGL